MESTYDEIESWPATIRWKLIVKLLERECTHGDHPRDVKDPLYAAMSRLRQYEEEM